MFAKELLQNILQGEQSQKESNSRQNAKSNNLLHLLVLRYPDDFTMKLSPQAARAIEALITGYSDQSFWIIARLARIRYLNDPQQADHPASPLLFFQAADELTLAKIVAPLPRHLKMKRLSIPNPLTLLNQKGAIDPDT